MPLASAGAGARALPCRTPAALRLRRPGPERDASRRCGSRRACASIDAAALAMPARQPPRSPCRHARAPGSAPGARYRWWPLDALRRAAWPDRRSSSSPHSTIVLEDGWRAAALARAAAAADGRGCGATGGAPATDPARLEIFNNLFMHIAEQMGEVLKATAQSVNIRERLDYSCALFDAHGGLVANAPHMPVHLGSMGASVRAVMRRAAAPCARGRLAPQQPLSRRHPPAGHDGGDAGVPGRRRAAGLLRGLARPPRRHRRRDPRLHAALQPHHRRGRHPVRMLPAGRAPASCASASCCAAARRRRLAGAPAAAEPRGPARAAGRQRARHRRNRACGAAPRARERARLHARGAGQRRALRARRASRSCVPAASATRWTTARPSRCASTSTTARAGARDRLHRHLRRRERTTSTRRARCASPRCCTCSAR